MTKEVPRPAAELPTLLADHLDMLVTLCGLYDQGKMNAAPTIAANLRALLHQTGRSHALLFQLLPKTTEFFDTDKAAADGDSKCFCSYAGMAYPYGLPLGDQVVETWSPTLRTFDIRRFHTRFDYWWSDEIIFFAPNSFSRSDMVLSLSNKDGGSHFDPTLEKPYFNLTRMSQTGVVLSGGEEHAEASTPHSAELELFSKVGSGMQAVRAVVRQIAHEVLETLLTDHSQYRKQCRGAFNPQTVGCPVLISYISAEELPRRHHWKSPSA